MIVLIAALAVTATAPLPTARGEATASCKAQGALQTKQPMDPALLYRADGRLQALRLGELPKANHEKAVLRTIDGCAAPLYVGYSVGR